MRRKVTTGRVSIEQQVRVQATCHPFALEVGLKALLVISREQRPRRHQRREALPQCGAKGGILKLECVGVAHRPPLRVGHRIPEGKAAAALRRLHEACTFAGIEEAVDHEAIDGIEARGVGCDISRHYRV